MIIFFYFGSYSCAKVCQNLPVNHPFSASVVHYFIVTGADIHSVFSEGIYLVSDFFTDAVIFLKSVKDKEKNLHSTTVIYMQEIDIL